MKRLYSVLVLLFLFITGCAKDDVILNTKQFQIPMGFDTVCYLEIPEEWVLTEQDGFHYWKFNDDTTIYKTKASVHVGDKIDNCYYSTYAVSRNFEEYTLTITTNKADVKKVGKLLDVAMVETLETKQYRERGIDALPEYTPQEMAITSNGLYMPVNCDDAVSDVFTSCHYIDGSSFVTSWLMNYKLQDIKPMLHNLVSINTETGTVEGWYEDKDVYFCFSGDKVIATKRLTYNRWCCYLCSNDDYVNYVIQALHNIESK